MSLQSLFRRRPTASFAISLVALFVALGGAGWAAIHVPPGSVGTRQLQNGAVTNPKIRNLAVNFNKIAFGTVGIRRINKDQVQPRVYGRCAGTTGAIGSIDNAGHVTCNSTLPTELGTTSAPVPVGTAATPVATKALPAASNYLVTATPYATITSSTPGQQVRVSCTLGANGVSATRTIEVEVGASKQPLEQAIPITLPAPSRASAGTGALSCSQASTPPAPVPTVTVQSTLNALQTATNG
jgi:hypothetical protein